MAALGVPSVLVVWVPVCTHLQLRSEPEAAVELLPASAAVLLALAASVRLLMPAETPLWSTMAPAVGSAAALLAIIATQSSPDPNLRHRPPAVASLGCSMGLMLAVLCVTPGSSAPRGSLQEWEASVGQRGRTAHPLHIMPGGGAAIVPISTPSFDDAKDSATSCDSQHAGDFEDRESALKRFSRRLTSGLSSRMSLRELSHVRRPIAGRSRTSIDLRSDVDRARVKLRGLEAALSSMGRSGSASQALATEITDAIALLQGAERESPLSRFNWGTELANVDQETAAYLRSTLSSTQFSTAEAGGRWAPAKQPRNSRATALLEMTHGVPTRPSELGERGEAIYRDLGTNERGLAVRALRCERTAVRASARRTHICICTSARALPFFERAVAHYSIHTPADRLTLRACV